MCYSNGIVGTNIAPAVSVPVHVFVSGIVVHRGSPQVGSNRKLRSRPPLRSSHQQPQ